MPAPSNSYSTRMSPIRWISRGLLSDSLLITTPGTVGGLPADPRA
jgi:hypothetical protein